MRASWADVKQPATTFINGKSWFQLSRVMRVLAKIESWGGATAITAAELQLLGKAGWG
jgi:hypothetical protein